MIFSLPQYFSHSGISGYPEKYQINSSYFGEYVFKEELVRKVKFF
jgi:hypothetical protein